MQTLGCPGTCLKRVVALCRTRSHSAGYYLSMLCKSGVFIMCCGNDRFVDPHLNTQWDVIANNPTWMPPEVVDVSAKPHEFNQSTDVYPLGIIMWELMTLEKPWSIQDDMARRVAQIIACLVLKRDRPPIPEDLSTVPGAGLEEYWSTRLTVHV